MSTASDQRSRSLNIDLIRVIAMVMVVLLHTILNFTLRPDFFVTKLWFLFDPIISLSKTSVLLFFAVSGYLLLTKARTISDQLQKTVIRIFLPLTIFTVFDGLYMYSQYQGPSVGDFLSNQFMRLIGFPSSALWFLWVLGFFYLLTPVLQLLFSPTSSRALGRYAVVMALGFSVITNLVMYSTPGTLSFFNVFTGWMAYLSFYLYGGLVKKGWILFQNQAINITLVVVGLVLAVSGDYYITLNNLRTTHLINFLTVPVIMMTVCIFNALMTADFSFLAHSVVGRVVSKLIKWLAGLSFGVYLIHPIVINIIRDLGKLDFNVLQINVYVFNALYVGVVLGVSILVSFILKKIPIVRMMIGG